MNTKLRVSAVCVGLVLVGGLVATGGSASGASLSPSSSVVTSGSTTYTATILTQPTRTVLRNASGVWVATFTNGSRSVALAGPGRKFSEPSTTSATVTTNVWVRLAPTPFAGVVDPAWLVAALADTTPDVLAVAMQYVYGAPAITSAGVTVAGDASYGPLVNGARVAGSDFNDYLGLAWRYSDGFLDAAETAQIRSLDCSGYVRMVFGFRLGMPLARTVGVSGALPRRAFEMAGSAPGTVLVSSPTRPALPTALQAGDLVFFDASTTDGTQIDHTGIYLGSDSSGRARFISSRQTADGPTLGDVGGASILTGTGYWATAFRAVRRL